MQRLRITRMIHIDEQEVQEVMSALAHPARRRILRELDTRFGREIGYLRRKLGGKDGIFISRQGIHKHLMVLRRARLLIGGGRGQDCVYFMNPQPIRNTFRDLGRLFKRDPYPMHHPYYEAWSRSPIEQERELERSLDKMEFEALPDDGACELPPED